MLTVAAVSGHVAKRMGMEATGAERARSRSPRGGQDANAGVAHGGSETVGETPAANEDGNTVQAAKLSVPSHWLSTPAPGGEDKAPENSAAGVDAAPRKGKGKGKGKRLSFDDVVDGEESRKPEEQITAAGLLAMAGRVEVGEADASPVQLGQFLRRAGAHMAVLEKAVAEAVQTLQTVKALTGRALEGFGASPDSNVQLPEAPVYEEGTRSFMIKRGDDDLAEAHRRAQEGRPSGAVASTGGTVAAGASAEGEGTNAREVSGGGALSSAVRTKEQMDQARLERLQRLEAQQAQKKKEMEDAAAKGKARDALFERQLVGASKPLGKL